MGLTERQDAIKSQRMADALKQAGYGTPPPAVTQPIPSPQASATGQTAPAPTGVTVGGPIPLRTPNQQPASTPAGGQPGAMVPQSRINPQSLALLKALAISSGDPSILGKIAELEQGAFLKSQPDAARMMEIMGQDPIVMGQLGHSKAVADSRQIISGGTTIRNPISNKVEFVAPKLGEGQYQLADGSVGNLPGYTTAVGQTDAAKAQAVQPYQMGSMEVPIMLPGGDQTTIKLNPVQAADYNKTGRLPDAIANSIPGFKQPGAQIQQQAMPSSNQELSEALRAALTADAKASGSPDGSFTTKFSGSPVGQYGYAPNQSGTAVTAPVSESGVPVVGRTQSESDKIKQARQTAAGKATDDAFAKDFVQFTTGGAQDAMKQLAQLQDVVTALKDPNASLTGPFVGNIPDAVRKFTNPQAIAMRERVEEVVQRSLRIILGAQFTEKEGERLIARAYNPGLEQSENATRVGRLLTQLDQAYENKVDASQYFQKNGTLQGWSGKLPSMADFDPSPIRSNRSVSGKVGSALGGIKPQYATNGSQRIMSIDGGVTWQPAK